MKKEKTEKKTMKILLKKVKHNEKRIKILEALKQCHFLYNLI